MLCHPIPRGLLNGRRHATSHHCAIFVVLLALLLRPSIAFEPDPMASKEMNDETNEGSIYLEEYPAPQNVSIEPTGSTTLMVSWDRPREEDLVDVKVTSYRIKWKVKGTKTTDSVLIEPSRTYYELSNLNKGTEYLVKVSIFLNRTIFATTQWYEAQTLERDLDESTVPDKPNSLRAKPTANSITVYWQPPRNKNILVTHYLLGWGVGIPDTVSQMINASQRSFTIEKLTPGLEYVLSLRANNRMGPGQPIYETVKTMSDTADETSVLTPPVGLQSTPASSTSIHLEWADKNHYANDNGRWYLIRLTPSIHSTSPKYRYVNATGTDKLIEDLKPDMQYEFAVKVIKGKRNSTWSMSAINTTHEAIPSTAPRDLTVVESPDDDPRKVNVHWQPPKQPNGQITGYVIFYTIDNTKEVQDWQVFVVTGDKLNAVLVDLVPNSIYHFKIQARNHKGYGPLSTPVSFKTLEANVLAARKSHKSKFALDTNQIGLIVVTTVALVLLILVLRFYCKNRSAGTTTLKGHKGYHPTATSPGGANGGKNINSCMNNSRELKPPDLWIDQVELKSIDKNSMRPSAPESPIMLRSTVDNSFAKIKKTNSTYGMNSSLYDDINKPTSPTDSIGIATMRRVSTLRAKPSVEHAFTNNVLNLEPSTGLSRPLYPKSQFQLHRPPPPMNLEPMQQNNPSHFYDPVSMPPPCDPMTGMVGVNGVGGVGGGAIGYNGPVGTGMGSSSGYMSGNSSSSPHSVISNNTVLTNSSMATNMTNSSTSPPNTSIYMSNKRVVQQQQQQQQQQLKSFGMPTPPPALPSLATLNSLGNGQGIYNSTSIASPSKKFLLTTTNNLASPMCGSSSTLASNGKSHFSDDHSISASFNAEDTNQEIMNLDNLIKDLNAMKPNGLQM